jgi:hypothetical protein
LKLQTERGRKPVDRVRFEPAEPASESGQLGRLQFGLAREVA